MAPNPSRFEKFDLLDDETGFKIQGTDHIFYFDKYGGWYGTLFVENLSILRFDEYGHYFNAKGKHCPAPEYSSTNSYVSEDEDDLDDDIDYEIVQKADMLFSKHSILETNFILFL